MKRISTPPRPQRLPRMRTLPARLAPAVAIAGGAVLLRAIAAVGFANYDTLYALAWGQQLANGQRPQYWIRIAPTPHPLMEAIGFALSPLGPNASEQIVVWLGFLALSACCWAVCKLGALWFGRAAGLLAGLIVITRMPILSYGVRAYIDVPYMLLVLLALLVESRRPRAGAPVLSLLALAGLLRPEAWAFSGLYWIYLALAGRWGPLRKQAPRKPWQLARLALLALSAPIVWVASDWAVTGDPLWSLINTRHTARTLDRATGVLDVPEYIPRRIGEILRPPVLLGAALGGMLSLLWLRSRALLGAIAGVVAVAVFAFLASFGLPIDTRYAFLAAAILAIFCGAGAFGWTLLPKGHHGRRAWAIGGAVVIAGLIAYAPAGYRSAHAQLTELSRQQRIQHDLVALVESHAITTGCGDVEVPGHAPIPLLALYLNAKPSQIVSDATRTISHGTYLDPASKEVEEEYTLDPHEPRPKTVTVPPGFAESHANRSWLVFERCLATAAPR